MQMIGTKHCDRWSPLRSNSPIVRRVRAAVACGMMLAAGLFTAVDGAHAKVLHLPRVQFIDSFRESTYSPGPYRLVIGIRYGERSDQRLDLLYPANQSPVGVIVWAHGGGWVAGSRRQARTQLMTRWLIDQGWAIASFDYRLITISRGPRRPTSFPAAIADAQVATRWVMRNAKARNLGDKILLGGWSAGGNIATMSSVVNPNVTGERGEPLRVDGVLSVGGITDMWAMYNVRYSFYSYIAAWYVGCETLGDVAAGMSGGRCNETSLRSRLATASVAHHVRRASRSEQYIPPLYLIAGEKDPLVRPNTQAVATARLWRQLTGSPSLAVADVMVNGAHDPKFGEFDDRQLSKWLRSIRDETNVPYRELHFRCHFLSRRSCVSMYGLARR